MAYRIPEFLNKARQVASKEEARQLCEAELEWIYQSYSGHTPHKVVNAYRKALRDNDLWEPFVRRTIALVEDGETLDEQGYLPGYMRERQEHVQARIAADHQRLEEQNTIGEDAAMLVGREQVYLHRMMRALLSSSWPELAVGIGMATGRRTIELCLSAHMRPSHHPYEVVYSGQAKTGSVARQAEEHQIPVLAPATLVCEALERLHAMLQLPPEMDYTQFDGTIGRDLRRATVEVLRPVFPAAPKLSPRTLRNLYVALALESETPDGRLLCPPTEKERDFIGRVLGHQDEMHKAADAYTKHLMPRLRRGIVLP